MSNVKWFSSVDGRPWPHSFVVSIPGTRDHLDLKSDGWKVFSLSLPLCSPCTGGLEQSAAWWVNVQSSIPTGKIKFLQIDNFWLLDNVLLPNSWMENSLQSDAFCQRHDRLSMAWVQLTHGYTGLPVRHGLPNPIVVCTNEKACSLCSVIPVLS